MLSAWTGAMVGGLLLVFLCSPVLAEFNLPGVELKLDERWESWKQTYNKMYHNETEEMFRRAVWEKNFMLVQLHNWKVFLGLRTYTLGINHMSDLTKEEIRKIYAPLRLPKDFKMTPTPLHVRNEEIPKTVDWRKKGRVTSVKNQGTCGSCWAFSTVGALEGLMAKRTGKPPVDLSPQNLVDCSGKYGNEGCLGGWTHYAFQYVIDNKGIDSEKAYPYEGQDDDCRYKPSYSAANCTGFRYVPKDEDSLKKACATVGPIAIGINGDDILQYSAGVYSDPGCSQVIDHGVLLVGYGHDRTSNLDYWLVKNSWGKDWGENGYIRLARNKSRMCGISMYALYPVYEP